MICSVPGCKRQHSTLGWCNAHYMRWTRHGDPLAGAVARGAVRHFITQVAPHITDAACVFWPFKTQQTGWPRVNFNGRMTTAHRAICEIVNGPPISPDLMALHSCGNGHLGCINPTHLRWGTSQDNMDDALAHGTVARGESNGASRLKESQVLEILALRGKAPRGAIAKMFGIHEMTVSRIHHGKRWKHLHDASETIQ